MKLLYSNIKFAYFFGKKGGELIKNNLQNFLVLKCNHICHKSNLDPEIIKDKAKPFPYLEKKYRFYHRLFEGVAYNTGKFDENTKVIIVEGNVGSGKSILAEKLAEELGMKFFPEINFDLEYIREDGFDLRDLNIHLPLDIQYSDIKSSFKTKSPLHFGPTQFLMFKNRFYNYISAFAHMLNTGQGIVIERSPWSDMVFAKQIYDEKFYSKDFLHCYLLLRANALTFLVSPHLIIYLDVPSDKCLINAKKKDSYEISNDLPNNFLNGIEKYYKEELLKSLEKSCELLICKSNNAITETNLTPHLSYLIDEIENIDFDYLQSLEANEKLFDWNFINSERKWQFLRNLYTWKKEYLINEVCFPAFLVDELSISNELLSNLRDDIYKVYAPKIEVKSIWEQIFGPKKSYLSIDRHEWFHATGFQF